MPAPKPRQLPRVTFEEVLKSQILLREKVWELMAQNRTFSEEEQNAFYEFYMRGTLGLGATTMVEVWADAGGVVKKEVMTLDSLVLTHLAPFSEKQNPKMVKSPQELWMVVLKKLNQEIFGKALQEAVRLSPERYFGKIYTGVKPELWKREEEEEWKDLP